MKGNELIEKILNKEIKSGTMIKMKSNYSGLEWEKELCFNGNWFSEKEYYPGVPRYDDIILHLCSDYITFEIIEDKKIEKLDIENDGYTISIYDLKNDESTILNNVDVLICEKVNEIIDKLNKEK